MLVRREEDWIGVKADGITSASMIQARAISEANQKLQQTVEASCERAKSFEAQIAQISQVRPNSAIQVPSVSSSYSFCFGKDWEARLNHQQTEMADQELFVSEARERIKTLSNQLDEVDQHISYLQFRH